MTDFKGIRGWKVQTLSTDPAASAISATTWASGGNMNTAKKEFASCGTQTSNFTAGGTDRSSPTNYFTIHEQYDGTSWTEAGDINQERYSFSGAGTTTSSLIFGGYIDSGGPITGVTESWNGSAWTEVADISARYGNWGVGASNTSALCFGGYNTTTEAKTEEWNGSSWTEKNDLNSARYGMSGTGTATAALAIAGVTTTRVASVESWDGTSWTEIADVSTARNTLGASGSYTLALAYGGSTPSATASTEYYDGTSWTELNDLSSARYQLGGSQSGTSTAALAVGGANPSIAFTATEEWTTPSTFSKINLGQVYFNSDANAFKVTEQPVPPTTWSSGTSLNQARNSNNASGNLTSAITFGGSPAPTQAYSEQWNGSTWTEVADLNEGRVAGAGGGASGTDAIMAGGYVLPNIGIQTSTEIWDGSSWTEVNDLNGGKYVTGSGIPISTSGLAFGGSGTTADTEIWDGTNWTETSNLNTARMYLGSFGSATSSIAAGGLNPSHPSPYGQNVVESWDGSSWTEVSEMNTARGEMLQGQGSSNTAGIIAGGTTTGSNQVANTELWNGSSWTELNDLGTARRMGGQIGSTTNGMYVGGRSPGDSVLVEEWDSPLSNATITVS